jgi:EAL domain-containing protein (putative c-di-GMP-specific phosphodiesterase class I)
LVPVAVTSLPVDPVVERFESALAQIWMAYQPLFDIEGGLFGYEALVRSDEPTMASPMLILDSADRLRRVHDLGRRVRRNVASTIAGSPVGPQVFVNFHPLDLLDDTLYDTDDPLAAHAPRVVLEITERAALDELPDAEARIRALRDLGYRVAVDDLGAGYAGLTTLARISPEVVKLDMSLIRNVDRDRVRQKLVRMVAAVSHDLGAVVVAEGIETESERATVVELGCDLLQGHLLGRPERLATLKTRP